MPGGKYRVPPRPEKINRKILAENSQTLAGAGRHACAHLRHQCQRGRGYTRRVPFTLAIVSTVLLYIWFVEGRTTRDWVYVPAALVIALTAWHDARSREWGFNWKAFTGAARLAGVWTGIAVCGILIAGALAGTIHDRRDFLGHFAALTIWGAAQQWVLQTAVLRDSQRATTRHAGIGIAALLFGLVHMPNVFLATMTTIGALIWCGIYDRYPNIVPLALSHALATLAILYAFDEAITGRLRIGASYLRLVPEWPRPF
jgi:membrane protease YdiL (CAAX protease family)